MSYDDHNVFRGVLDAIDKSERKLLTLDITGLESIDSAGIGMLVIAHDRAVDRGIILIILNPKGIVRKLLELSRLDKHLTIRYQPEKQ